MKIGIIGTREPDNIRKLFCEALATVLAEEGHIVVSGGADGIDQIALKAAEKAGGETIIFLPWANYNQNSLSDLKGHRTVYDSKIHQEWAQSVCKYHPNPSVLTQGSFKLHARNYGIIDSSDLVIAFPSLSGGGTAQGMRLAEALHKPLYTLCPGDDTDLFLENLCDFLEGYKS
jgi:predicted Rossmann-fold nucleotide-binding protein